MTNTKRLLAIAALLFASLAASSVAQADSSLPKNMLYSSKPAKNELSFDTGDSEPQYCTCAHKECDYYRGTEYITCWCVWVVCSDFLPFNPW